LYCDPAPDLGLANRRLNLTRKQTPDCRRYGLGSLALSAKTLACAGDEPGGLSMNGVWTIPALDRPACVASVYR
jgi:hypothetical protein